MSNVESLKEQGNSFFKSKDYKKAIQFYKEGLQINPANWILNNNLAQAYLANKDYSEAETHAVVTVALKADSVKGYYRAAKAAFNLNKHDRALTYVRKGLTVSPDSEELRSFLAQLKDLNPEIVNGFPEKPGGKAGNMSKKEKKGNGKKDRSRSKSDSRISPANEAEANKQNSSNAASEKTETEQKTRKKSKANRGPIEIEDIQNDKILKTVESLLEEQKANKPTSDSFENIRQDLFSYMRDGSEALEKGLSRNASEKYKSAVDIILTHSYVVFGMKEIDYVILRYSLSISYIDTASYSDILKSLDSLKEIEEKHSAKLPAVYYALGNAYCKLNRFAAALQHLDKGLKVIEKGFKITTHPWPGTMNIINETKKSGLQESLEALIHYCKTYRKPDAICRYKKCLDISTHIIPSEFIFYSDPDYIGYVVVICEANCEIMYHIQCWKAFKESLGPLLKVSDKEMLGKSCVTSDCVNEANEPSVIVKIQIYGDDGNIKSTCNKEPCRPTNNNTKENKKEKKKKDKTVDTTCNVKTKVKRKKEQKINSTLTKDVPSTNISEKVKRLQKLEALRKLNFGFDPEQTFMPDAEYFGRSDIASLENYLTPEYVGETPELKNKKDFVFTYFFEYINNEGPQKIKDIEEKWKDEVSQFHGVAEFMSEGEGICNFLLQSLRFAAVDEYVCLARQLPDAYALVQSRLGEGVLSKLGAKTSAMPSTSPAPTVSSEDSPVHAEPTIDPEPDGEVVPKTLDSLPEVVYISDEYSSESESDEEIDDEEDKIDDREDDSTLNANLILNAEEVTPPQFQPTTLENFYDSLMEEDNHLNEHGKEKFIEYVLRFFQTMEVEKKIDDIPDSEVVAPIPEPPSLPQVDHKSTETEPGRNFQEEIEILTADIKSSQLRYEALEKKYTKECEKCEKYNDSLKAYDDKIISLENERIKEIKILQAEISKRDSKMDVMLKKYADQVTSVKDLESKVKDLIEKSLTLTAKLQEHEEEGRKSQKAMLESKNALGIYMINSYLEKCTEKLGKMKSMLKYFTEVSTPSSEEVKEAIKQWEGVQKQAEMIREQFKIQYSVLSKELLTTGKMSGSLEFSASSLPPEPACDLDDIESTILKALEKLNGLAPINFGGGGDAIAVQNSHVNTVSSDARSSPLSQISSQFPHQARGQDLFMGNGAVPFRCGTFQTGAFGVAPSFAAPVPAQSVMPPGIERPFIGYVNGRLPLEKDGKFSSLDMPKSFAEPKAAVEPLKKPLLGVAPIKQEPFQSSAVHVPLLKPTEKKKVSSAAGLTPIEPKVGPSFPESKKLALGSTGAVPKTTHKPHFVMNAEGKSQAPGPQKMWRYQKLLGALKEFYRTYDDEVLADCLAVARERNNNSLSGVTIPTIYDMVGRILKERSEKKQAGNMAMDKFGGCPWAGVKNSTIDWNKPDDDFEECIICHSQMTSGATSLQCKHTFHNECIRQWLGTNSTCPICRKYTTMNDEFPPLA